MVKSYRNRFLRKYKEDFLLHLWFKQEPLDNLGQSLLQKIKSKHIWTYSAKRKKAIRIKKRFSKMMRYLAIRAAKKNAYLWTGLHSFNLKESFVRKKVIKTFHFLKFRSLFSKLLMRSRHSIYYKDLEAFYSNIYWFGWTKYTGLSFAKFIYIAYLLNWNKSLDFNKFKVLQNRSTNCSLNFLNLKKICVSQYLYNDKYVSGHTTYNAHKLAPLPYKNFQNCLKEIL